jgi:hypothetical protein
MNIEFLILFVKYYKTFDVRTVVFDIISPLLIGLIVYFTLMTGVSIESTLVFKENSISLLGILAGFSITIITILTSSESKIIQCLRLKNSEFKYGNKKITLFEVLLINFSYSVILESFLIIFCLIYPIFLDNFTFDLKIKIVVFSTLVFFVTHIMFLTIRNITNFYFTMTLDYEKNKCSKLIAENEKPVE